MSSARRMVWIAGIVLLAIWIGSNYSRITSDQHGFVRFVLGGLFALLILFRPKTDKEKRISPTLPSLVTGVVGAGLAVGGIVFGVHQFEWLGVIFVLYACLRWGLPRSHAGDILLALVLLYWIHPLPGQIFGKMQLMMQTWGVAGAEWVLHCLNVRVWTHAFVLHTSYMTIAVPDSCSGMRASITVILLAWGMGVLLRYRWWEILALSLLGVGQVLLLNIARITAVVMIAPSMDPTWAETFLHDTLGTFLLVAIVLIAAEASIWQVIRTRRQELADGIRANVYERPNTAKPMPRFWILFFRYLKLIVLAVILLSIAAAAAYKSRPLHRTTMRREVISGLMDTDIETAIIAIDQALLREPEDRDLLSKRATIFVMQKKFNEALEVFAILPEPLSPFETVLKSWSLMGTGERQEAIAMIDRLPTGVRKLPGVAIVRAEYAVLENDPLTAAEYIVHAGNSSIPTERLRALYQFLSANSQWDAIRLSDADEAYMTPFQAYCAIQACLRVNDLKAASRVMKHIVRKWPKDSRFLSSLFTLAVGHEGAEWVSYFTRSLRSNVRNLEPAKLSQYMEYSFQLRRPDLAWMTYLALGNADPEHVDLSFGPGRYGAQWFLIRESVFGGKTHRKGNVDLRAIRNQTRHLWPLGRMWSGVPLGGEFEIVDPGAVQGRYFEACLSMLETRRANGTISRRGRILLPAAFATHERYDEAHEALDELVAHYPELEAEVLQLHGEFYDRSQKWGDAYEALRTYLEITTSSDLKPRFLLINALLNMNLGAYGFAEAESNWLRFPGEESSDVLLAAVWELFGFREQALHLLGYHQGKTALFARARLYAETGRKEQAEKLYGALGVLPKDMPPVAEQFLQLHPAESAIRRRWETPLSEDEAAAAADHLASLDRGRRSPFISALNDMTIAWYRQGGSAEASDPAAWADIGRDTMEKVSALHRLAVVKARQLEFDDALTVLDEAVALFPNSPVLQRMRVSLSEGDPLIVKAARKACPRDPEIWLAGLVVRNLEDGPGAWGDSAVRVALEHHSFSPETWVRAGDFLYRAGMLKAANRASQHAVEEANGMVAAYYLGLRCALELRNIGYALKCARLGVENCEDPGIFWKAIVEVKSIEGSADGDMISALRNLSDSFPEEEEWGQYLGQIHFARGESKEALRVLESMIVTESDSVTAESHIIAAESARLAGQRSKAIRILSNACALHPGDVKLLNNLVYMLALRPETAARAMKRLPELLSLGDESFAVLDTAAMVCLKNNQIARAEEYMARALSKLEEDSYSALEVRLNAAELQVVKGEFAGARESIQAIRTHRRITKQLDERARRLIDRIQQLEAEQEP